MNRPMVYILFVLIWGMIAEQYFSNTIGVALFVCSLIIFAYIVAKIFSVKKAIFLVIAGLLGFVLMHFANKPTNTHVEMIADTKYKPYLNITINKLCGFAKRSKKYLVTTNYIKIGDKIYYDNINMFYYTNQQFTSGDIVELKCEVSTGKDYIDFDYNSYIKSEGCEYVIMARAYKSGEIRHIHYYLELVNNKMSNILDTLYPKREAGILKAMILGDKKYLDEDINEIYKQAGISHIIAVSGLHLSIIASILMLLFSKVHLKRLTNIIVLILLLGYCILTGCSPSIVRATIMIYVSILGKMLGQDYDLISSCSFACILIICHNPYAMYGLGFLYSFASVFLIGMSSDILNKWRINNTLLASMFISFVVSLGLKPITSYYFGYINMVDFFVNIIVISLSTFVLALGILSLFIGYFSKMLGVFFAGFPYILLKFIEYLSEFSLSLPLASINVKLGSPLEVFLIYALIFVLYLIVMNWNKFKLLIAR